MSVKRNPCTIYGIHYESEYAAGKALGLDVGALRFRLRSPSYPEYTSRCYPKEERRNPAVSCRVDGVEYASVTNAARKLGLSITALRTRLASPDFPDYVCADIPKKPPKPLKYTVRGKLYRTLQEVADEEGVTREWIRQRMNDPSYPDYISADIPKGPPPSPKYMVNGKPYRTLREIAEAEGLTKYKVRQKLDNPSCLEYQQSYKRRT